MTQLSVQNSESFYKKIFWIAVVAIFGAVGTGVASFFTLQANFSNLSGLVSEMRNDLKEIGKNRYDAGQAAMDRNALLGTVSAVREDSSAQANALAAFLKTQTDINTVTRQQVTELLIFKAQIEERERQRLATTPK